MLATLFDEIFMRTNGKKVYPIVNDISLEEALRQYIFKVMGYHVYNEYIRSQEPDSKSVFPYYAAVRKWLVNLIQNFDYNSTRSLIEAIDEYGDNFYAKIEEHPYVNKLIKGLKKLYSSMDNDPNVYIDHRDKKYRIGLIDDKASENMPAIVINNIDNVEKVLEEYVNTVVETDNAYKYVLEDASEDDMDKKITSLIMWTLINASNYDALDIERYFNKYISFLKDDTFDYYKHHVRKIGDLLNDEMYLLQRQSTCSYETPYYLAFMLKNRHVELPNVRLGIEDIGDRKVAHILSIQSTQMNKNPIEDPIINKEIKSELPKTPNFREFNPSHLLSLTIVLGFLNGSGIKDITVYDYLPMRFQRFIREGRMNERELYDYQHRLTNKFVNVFFRLMEFTDGIETVSYPENCNNLMLTIKGKLVFNSELLNKAYEIGYSQANNLNNNYKIKEI